VVTLLVVGPALLFAAWATWPPRGEQRGWLLLALVALWAALVAEGWRRGVTPGFLPWLAVLALVGALVALLVLWSLTNMMGRRRGEKDEV
jgi:hypothetical protein